MAPPPSTTSTTTSTTPPHAQSPPPLQAPPAGVASDTAATTATAASDYDEPCFCKAGDARCPHNLPGPAASEDTFSATAAAASAASDNTPSPGQLREAIAAQADEIEVLRYLLARQASQLARLQGNDADADDSDAGAESDISDAGAEWDTARDSVVKQGTLHHVSSQQRMASFFERFPSTGSHPTSPSTSRRHHSHSHHSNHHSHHHHSHSHSHHHSHHHTDHHPPNELVLDEEGIKAAVDFLLSQDVGAGPTSEALDLTRISIIAQPAAAASPSAVTPTPNGQAAYPDPAAASTSPHPHSSPSSAAPGLVPLIRPALVSRSPSPCTSESSATTSTSSASSALPDFQTESDTDAGALATATELDWEDEMESLPIEGHSQHSGVGSLLGTPVMTSQRFSFGRPRSKSDAPTTAASAPPSLTRERRSTTLRHRRSSPGAAPDQAATAAALGAQPWYVRRRLFHERLRAGLYPLDDRSARLSPSDSSQTLLFPADASSLSIGDFVLLGAVPVALLLLARWSGRFAVRPLLAASSSAPSSLARLAVEMGRICTSASPITLAEAIVLCGALHRLQHLAPTASDALLQFIALIPTRLFALLSGTR